MILLLVWRHFVLFRGGDFVSGEKIGRFLAPLVLVTALALAAACGSGGGEKEAGGGMGGGMGGGGGAQEGQAPPAAESIPSAAADVGERMDELVLSEDDVPADFSSLGSMGMDFDLDFLDMPTPQGMAAHMSIFATSESEDMIVSMVILMEDDAALDEAFSQIDDLSIEEMQDAFNMVGAYADVALLDTRELDVSGLGDRAYGLGLTMEVLQMGTMDTEMVFFGEGPLLAMAMTMAMGGGAAVDVVSLAETMADKIDDVVQ
jgi:hypothetical protein